MGFPLDALLAWGLINIVTLFITVIFCVGEDSVIFVPMWRAVWSVIPLNLAGKIVTCIASGILFLPTDICFFHFNCRCQSIQTYWLCMVVDFRH